MVGNLIWLPRMSFVQYSAGRIMIQQSRKTFLFILLSISGAHLVACGGDAKSDKDEDKGISVKEICELDEASNDAEFDSVYDLDSCKEKYEKKKKDLGDKGWEVFAECRKGEKSTRRECTEKGRKAAK